MPPLTTMNSHRPRSNRTNNTIHGRAESGDLAGFRALLADNPAFLNECNPILSQTPLHVAAGDNRVEIVQFLFDWRGPGELELEVKNVYGETPLHMAAKQGCGDTTMLLLSHGASVEAKTNDDRCPVDHLSQGPGIAELRELLHRHVEEQRRRRAIEACSEANAKMDELENELSNIVGLNDVKLQLRKWVKGMLLDERRRALGLKVGARRPPHMAFLGNPGTGKTMVARVLGKLLHMVGILPTNKVTEVQRTDLVGEFIGHTRPKTRRMIKEAEGGILFVDEAYRLVPSQKSDDKDYGLEALEEIMSVMDSSHIRRI
ncbi:Stage V sporulation protein K-like protein [Drosera capensis]